MNITDVAAQVLRKRQLAVMTGRMSWDFPAKFSISMDKDKAGRQRQIIVFRYVPFIKSNAKAALYNL